jgi:hypothetical protein
MTIEALSTAFQSLAARFDGLDTRVSALDAGLADAGHNVDVLADRLDLLHLPPAQPDTAQAAASLSQWPALANASQHVVNRQRVQ